MRRAALQEAARDVPRSEAERRQAARGCTRGAAHRASGVRRPRAVESRRLRATRPAQRPRAFEQHAATREALLTERAGASWPRAVERLRVTRPARRPSDDAA